MTIATCLRRPCYADDLPGPDGRPDCASDCLMSGRPRRRPPSRFIRPAHRGAHHGGTCSWSSRPSTFEEDEQHLDELRVADLWAVPSSCYPLPSSSRPTRRAVRGVRGAARCLPRLCRQRQLLREDGHGPDGAAHVTERTIAQIEGCWPCHRPGARSPRWLRGGVRGGPRSGSPRSCVMLRGAADQAFLAGSAVSTRFASREEPASGRRLMATPSTWDPQILSWTTLQLAPRGSPSDRPSKSAPLASSCSAARPPAACWLRRRHGGLHRARS